MKNYLIFEKSNKTFAISSSNVVEILRNEKVHSLPFLPSLVKGVIFFKEKTFSVLDTNILFEKTFGKAAQKNDSFENLIVLNYKDEDFCLCADKIINLQTKLMFPIKKNDFFCGKIKLLEEEVFVLDLEKIIETERSALGFR